MLKKYFAENIAKQVKSRTSALRSRLVKGLTRLAQRFFYKKGIPGGIIQRETPGSTCVPFCGIPRGLTTETISEAVRARLSCDSPNAVQRLGSVLHLLKRKNCDLWTRTDRSDLIRSSGLDPRQ